jgi:uncharacterized protein YhaN
MKLLTRAMFTASFGVCALGLLPAAQAQSPAEIRAHAAEATLSDRYTRLWTQMPAAERAAFSQTQRHWLHVTRWEEQRRCTEARLANVPASEASEVAANCLAEITLRHLQTLPPPALAAS